MDADPEGSHPDARTEAPARIGSQRQEPAPRTGRAPGDAYPAGPAHTWPGSQAGATGATGATGVPAQVRQCAIGPSSRVAITVYGAASVSISRSSRSCSPPCPG